MPRREARRYKTKARYNAKKRRLGLCDTHSIRLHHLASIQPRTSPVKFARSLRTDPYYRSSRSSGESTNPCNRSLPTRADSSSHEAYDFAEDGDIGGDLSLGLPVFFVPVFRVPIYWYVIFPYRYFRRFQKGNYIIFFSPKDIFLGPV